MKKAIRTNLLIAISGGLLCLQTAVGLSSSSLLLTSRSRHYVALSRVPVVPPASRRRSAWWHRGRRTNRGCQHKHYHHDDADQQESVDAELPRISSEKKVALDRTTTPRTNTNKNRRRLLLANAAIVLVPSLCRTGQVSWAASSESNNREDDDEKNQVQPIVTICDKPASGSPPNCISTASVRQVDLYAAPWTWSDDSLSTEMILARLKGAIAVVDPTMVVTAQTSHGLVASAKRNFCTDQLVFRINPSDRAVTYQSRQVAGPDVSDFGANRQRLEQIRRMTRVLQVMGTELESADSSGRRETTTDQLKAFWGLQSGGGYESVLLDDDEYF